jgi:eukaryotic-like serine/threonine-protein kinase
MKLCSQCSSPLDTQGNCPRCLLKVAASFRDAPSALDESLHPDQIRASFPQLEILRLVGRGGMGTIYHARQTALDRDVALKIIDPKISKEREFLERFEREAKALAKLSHPNVVTVFDYGRTPEGLAYFVMEYVHGLNLREAMQAMPMSLEDSLEIVNRYAKLFTTRIPRV